MSDNSKCKECDYNLVGRAMKCYNVQCPSNAHLWEKFKTTATSSDNSNERFFKSAAESKYIQDRNGDLPTIELTNYQCADSWLAYLNSATSSDAERIAELEAVLSEAGDQIYDQPLLESKIMKALDKA
tara:strand:+ start:37442 stop:37825 length:384 start_codon:yes stop_codon:yes gene_type:complete